MILLLDQTVLNSFEDEYIVFILKWASEKTLGEKAVDFRFCLINYIPVYIQGSANSFQYYQSIELADFNPFVEFDRTTLVFD